MHRFFTYCLLTVIGLFSISFPGHGANSSGASEELNIKEFILEHLADNYEWQIVSNGERHLAIPLPVILYSEASGWHLFSSARFQHGKSGYKNFHLASEGTYKGKIVETDSAGNESRPLDLSLTKNATSLLFSSLLLIIIVMAVARSMKRNPLKAGKGFVGMMEMFIM